MFNIYTSAPGRLVLAEQAQHITRQAGCAEKGEKAPLQMARIPYHACAGLYWRRPSCRTCGCGAGVACHLGELRNCDPFDAQSVTCLHNADPMSGFILGGDVPETLLLAYQINAQLHIAECKMPTLQQPSQP